MKFSSNTSEQVSFLTTKLYVPPIRPDFVSRPRLLARLNESRHRKLTLISAPAGFGKTTLLSEWISLGKTRTCVAWLSLDEGDNEPVRFLAYFVTALQTVEADIGDIPLAGLQSTQHPSLETLLTGVINEIAANSVPLTLVLDDNHTIEAQPIHDALTFLLDHMPPHMHLIIATRADPPLPISRLRARGKLTELRADDLRFTVEETTGLLNEVMGLNLSAADVNALDVRTEGWIVGLQMAALSMRGRKDVSGFIKAFSGSNRFILDYLVEEVLEQQPGDVQEFLLKTSILERMAAPVCDLITDRDDSQSTLESLEAANLFLVPLDEERRWYRYHQLFAGLLRQLLQREAPDLVPELHRRASKWYEQNGLIAEAVGHALAAGDFERTARLIEQTAWPMLTRGEMSTLLNWLERLPDELVHSRPRLGVFQAWALTLTSQPDHAELLLRDIDTQGLEGEVAAVRAYIARFRGDAPRAIELCRRALGHLPEENLFLRSVMALSLGNAYWASGDLTSASRALADAATLGQATGDIHLAMIATSILGHAQEMQGGLHQAAETYRQALQLATPKSEGGGRPAPFAGLAYMGLAGPLYEWSDLDGAMGHAMKGIELGERGGSVRTLQGCYTILAQVYQAQGDVDAALEALHEAEGLARRHNLPHVIALVAALRARLRLAQGNITAASCWAQESGLSVDDEFSYISEIEYLTLAHRCSSLRVNPVKR